MSSEALLRRSVGWSLAAHLFVIAALILLLQRPAVRPPETILIDLQPLAKNLSRNQRIVQTQKGDKAMTPAPDAFLGEHNQRVDHQTVGASRITLMGKGSARATQQAPERPAAARRAASRAKPAVVPLAKLGLPILPSAREQEQITRDRPQWAPQMGAAPEDYVKGVDTGERTLLNTKEYVYYSYFQRIRENLDRAWIPILRSKLSAIYLTGRSIASDVDHSTKVLVILNARGEVVKVKVIEESGLYELDDSAVKAFNAAGPFPNPPKGLIEGGTEVKIPWEFILRA